MNDLQLLFVVLVVLYGWECICWLRRGGVAFATWLGRTWRPLHPGTLVANQSGGFVLAAPLPPLGSLVVANQFPLSVSPEGVLGFVATNVNPGWRPAQSGRYVRFDEIHDLTIRGRQVLVNDEPLVTCATPGLARHCEALLERLRKLKPEQREAALGEHLRNAFDEDAVAARWAEFQKLARGLKVLCNGLLVYVFMLLPVVVWQVGLKSSWPGLLIGLLALTTATSIFFRSGHRALYLKAEDERFTHTLTILLAPCTAMRAHDALSRPLLEEFHPLAVGKVFLPAADFHEFARRVWLDLRQPAWPLCPNENPDAQATERHARAATQVVVEAFLKRSKIAPEELGRAPAPTDETCRSYCPRCQAQFMTGAGTCTDCGGLALVAFLPINGKSPAT